MKINEKEVYEQAELFLRGNEVFEDSYSVRRFLDKYIGDICKDIEETADAGWSIDDLALAIQRMIAKKLEIED